MTASVSLHEAGPAQFPSNSPWFYSGNSLAAISLNNVVGDPPTRIATVSAGNQADVHWRGVYVPNSNLTAGLDSAIYESVMNFRPYLYDPSQQTCLPISSYTSHHIFMTWNAWDGYSDTDYDLFYYNSTNSHLLYNSTNSQFYSRPTESLRGGTDNGCLVVAKRHGGMAEHVIDISLGNNAGGYYVTDRNLHISGGSITSPADASAAITVGAVYRNGYIDTVESYSSRGPAATPTGDILHKPEICGYARTHSLDDIPYGGTSGSNPHVAGAAALLADLYKDQPIHERISSINRTLIESAIPIFGDMSTDLQSAACGVGVVSLNTFDTLKPEIRSISSLPRSDNGTIPVSVNTTITITVIFSRPITTDGNGAFTLSDINLETLFTDNGTIYGPANLNRINSSAYSFTLATSADAIGSATITIPTASFADLGDIFNTKSESFVMHFSNFTAKAVFGQGANAPTKLLYSGDKTNATAINFTIYTKTSHDLSSITIDDILSSNPGNAVSITEGSIQSGSTTHKFQVMYDYDAAPAGEQTLLFNSPAPGVIFGLIITFDNTPIHFPSNYCNVGFEIIDDQCVQICRLGEILLNVVCVPDRSAINQTTLDIRVDKESYTVGDSIIISGKVNPSNNTFGLAYRINEVSTGILVHIGQISHDYEGAFNDTVKTGPQWRSSGQYEIFIKYGGFERKLQFGYQAGPMISPPAICNVGFEMVNNQCVQICRLGEILLNVVCVPDRSAINQTTLDIRVDKESYTVGDSIIISGKVNPSNNTFGLAYRINEVSTGILVHIGQISHDYEGAFNDTVKTGPQWRSSGQYEIFIKYGGFERKLQFGYQASPPTITLPPTLISGTIADNESTIIFDSNQRYQEIIVNSSNTTLTRIIITEQTNEPRINFQNILNTTDDDTNTVVYPNELDMNVVFDDASANIVIPPQTRIMGSGEWSGIMNLPQFVEVPMTLNIGASQVTSVLEIGLDNDILTFDKPVRIVFGGKAVHGAGYQQGQNITLIEQSCKADDIDTVLPQLVGNGDECKITVGHDLVVWTMHFTRFFTVIESLPFNGPATSLGSSGGGGHKTTSVLAANMISYNACDPTKNGVVRILAFNSPHISNIKASVYSNDFMSRGADVSTMVSPNTYLENAKSNYVYTVFDAKLPIDTKKFFVTLSNVDDIRQTSSTLIDLTDSSATSCADTVFPHPLRDPTTVFRSYIEPITVNTVAVPLEQLRLELRDNSIMFENNAHESNSFVVVEPTVANVNTESNVVELTVANVNTESNVVEPQTETSTPSNVPFIDETSRILQNTQQQLSLSTTEKEIEFPDVIRPIATDVSESSTQNNIIEPTITDNDIMPRSVQKNLIESSPLLTAVDPSTHVSSLPYTESSLPIEPIPKEPIPAISNQERTPNAKSPLSSPNTTPLPDIPVTLDTFIQEQKDSIELVSFQFFTWLDNLFG